MPNPSASGERSALRGYRIQYDHAAGLIYDAILSGEFVRLRLADPEAGRADDLVLVLRDRTEAYQIKSTETSTALTFHSLSAIQDASTPGSGRSLIQSLAQAWVSLGGADADVRIHLVTNRMASTSSRVSDSADGVRPDEDHLAGFIRQVLNPLRDGTIGTNEIPAGWQPVYARFIASIDIDPVLIPRFMSALSIDSGARWPQLSADSPRSNDQRTLASALSRVVSEASDVVEFTLEQVLELVGWTGRPGLRTAHHFPVDLETYEPLTSALQALEGQLQHHDNGYVAVLGPPGSGKSTLLNQALSGQSDRIVKYFAYVPGAVGARSRLSAESFVHDLVVLLGLAGLQAADHSLPSSSLSDSRRQLHALLDAASSSFTATGRRTIIVVDGLDHVERDFDGPDGLLGELPSPTELPDGVLVLVGSRTLSPLSNAAQEQATSREAVLDLRQHRMTHDAVLAVCKRASVTSALPEELHHRIVDRVDGHPLTLGYILNSLAAQGTDPASVIDLVPAYAGDIGTSYAAIWDQLEDAEEVQRILAVCARLRRSFTFDWLANWADPTALQRFRRRFAYLFRDQHDGLRFFHDSFRQFVTDRTAGGTLQDGPSEAIERGQHRFIADLCHASGDDAVRDEELYHRSKAGEPVAVLNLARANTFRRQLRSFRAPQDIREDLLLAVDAAAATEDVTAMARCLLCLSELESREYLLRDIDVPTVLFEAGLVDEAILYAGVDERRSPLRDAYNLSYLLGRAGDQAGRAMFSTAEIDGLDESGTTVSGHEHDAATAWARAATFFRPLASVTAVLTGLLDDIATDTAQSQWRRRDRGRFEAVAVGIAAELLESRDLDGLRQLDDTLAGWCESMNERQEETPVKNALAEIIDIRLTIIRESTFVNTSADQAKDIREATLALVTGKPLFSHTIIDAADLLAINGFPVDAMALLRRGEKDGDEALTASTLGYSSRAESLDEAFRRWRIRHMANAQATGNLDLIDSVGPPADHPAGADIAPSAVSHEDQASIIVASQIDLAIRTLARIDAHTILGLEQYPHEVASQLIPLLNAFDVPTELRRSATFGGLRRHRAEVFGLLLEVAGRQGSTGLDRLVRIMDARISARSVDWSAELQVQLAQIAIQFGSNAPWLATALSEWEESLAVTDVYERLSGAAAIARAHALNGDQAAARRLAQRLVPLSFGVGYRKDYQFSEWSPWLSRTVVEQGMDGSEDDLRFLARLLVATEPLTEGAPRSAAEDLPASVATVSPLDGLRLFEFFVGSGTVSHVPAMASLLESLVQQLDDADEIGLTLAGEITTGIVGPAAYVVPDGLARELRRAAERILGDDRASGYTAALASAMEVNALATTRERWSSELLGIEPAPHSNTADASESDYGWLLLEDGRRISRSSVMTEAPSVPELLALRQAEDPTSTFRWDREIDGRGLTAAELSQLLDEFDPHSGKAGPPLAALAEQAERLGDEPLAAEIARSSLAANGYEHSWSRMHSGATRRRAAATLVRCDPEHGVADALADLAEQVRTEPYVLGMIINELADVVMALRPSGASGETWPDVRAYLDGMAESLAMPVGDPLGTRGTYWWLDGPTVTDVRERDSVDSRRAIALLAVRHLSHPSWLVRQAAVRTSRSGLKLGCAEVAEGLSELAVAAKADDTLEAIGQCLIGVDTEVSAEVEHALADAQRIVAEHPARHIRNCVAGRAATPRPLSGMYLLAAPPLDAGIGIDGPIRTPFGRDYLDLSIATRIPPRTFLAIADRYARSCLEAMPDNEIVQTALDRVNMKLATPQPEFWAVRAAFGRVLADLEDAGLFAGMPPEVERRLDLIDTSLLEAVPGPRPSTVPEPPTAGHDQTTTRWMDEIEARLADFVRSSTGDEVLIGLRMYLRVMNWGYLSEDVEIATAISEPGGHIPEIRMLEAVGMADVADITDGVTYGPLAEGEDLIVSNDDSRLVQFHGGQWIAFRPDVARHLGWLPDGARLGWWRTSAGEVAVRQLWWMDGWYGHNDLAFDDTEAEGYAVVMTAAGRHEFEAALPGINRSFKLTRESRESGQDRQTTTATHVEVRITE